MALTICAKIEEVIFLSKGVLIMCFLMECRSPGFQNAGNSALYVFMSSVCSVDKMIRESYCEAASVGDT